MATAAELVVLLTARDQMTSVLNGAKGSFDGFGNAAKTAGIVVAGAFVAAGVGIAAGVAKGVSAAADLESAVANISTIKPTIDTSEVFSALNELSTRVPQSAKQLGDSLYNVFSSIETTQTGALTLVEKFAQGAVGAQTDAQTFGTAVLGVMNAYKLGVEDADHISDVFFNTIKNGVITGEELAGSLGPVTQSAKAAGVDLNTLGGFIAGVTKEGGPASQNVNNLNNFLQKVTTEKAQLALKDLGIQTADATGNFRPIVDVLTDMKAKLDPLSESARTMALQEIFPDAQARIGALTLLSQLDFVKSSIDENINTAGAADAAFQKMNSTFAAELGKLQNTFTSVLAMIGVEILPILTPLIAAFAKELPGAFATLKTSLGPVVSSIAATFGSLAAAAQGPIQILKDSFATIVQVFQGDWAPDPAAIQPFTQAIGSAAIVVRDQLVPAIMLMGSFMAEHTEIVIGFGAALLTLAAAAAVAGTIAGIAGAIAFLVSPIGLIVVAIGILAAAWAGNWGDIQGITATAAAIIGAAIAAIGQFFSDLGTATSGVVSAIQATWDAITAATSAAWTAIITAVTTAWEGITTATSTAATGLTTAITETWAAVQAATDAALAFLGAAIIAAWEAIFNVETRAAFAALIVDAQTTWDLIVALITAALTLLGTVITTTWTEITTTITTAATAISTVITEKWTEITTSITTAMTAIGTTISTGWTAVQTTTSTILTALSTEITRIWTALGPAIDGAMNAVKSTVSAAWNAIKSAVLGILQSLVGAASSAGHDMVNAFAQGITNNLSSALSAARRMAQELKNLLPHSDAKEGPLSTLTAQGRALPATLAKGILAGTPTLLQATRTMASGMSSLIGASSTMVSQPTTGGTISSGASRGYLTPITVQVNAPIYGVNDMEDVVVRALERAGRRGRV